MIARKWLLTGLMGLGCVCAAEQALAVMSASDGWYLEANAGSAQSTNTPNHGSTSTSGIGGSADIGYKFLPYVAAEIGYTQYPNSSYKNSAGTKAATGKNYSYDIAARGILPISNSGFELFAKLGAGRLNQHYSINNQTAANQIGISNSQHSATGLYLGAGVQYYFMPEFAINTQWAQQQGNNSTGNYNLFSGGLSFIFS